MYPMTIPTQGVDFTSVQGPGDDVLPRNEVSGYSLVSRVGEVVIQAFVDTSEFSEVRDEITQKDALPGTGSANMIIERKPAYHDWATATVGMLAIARKNRNDIWRRNLAAESATPVIVCASCMTARDEKDFFFAGVVRTKSVMPPDDGIGPQVDEFFTLAIGGQVTVLNNCGERLSAGDWVAWTLDQSAGVESSDKGEALVKRQKLGVRRIGLLKVPSCNHPKVIGRVMQFARTGEPVDILLKQ